MPILDGTEVPKSVLLYFDATAKPKKNRTLCYPKQGDFPCFVLLPNQNFLPVGLQGKHKPQCKRQKCSIQVQLQLQMQMQVEVQVSASPRRSPHCNCTTLRCIHFWLKLTVADGYSKIKHAKATGLKCNNYIYEACWEDHTAKLHNLSRRGVLTSTQNSLFHCGHMLKVSK